MKLPWKKKLTEEEKLAKVLLDTSYLEILARAMTESDTPRDFKFKRLALVLIPLWIYLTLVAIILWH